jgi:hypothetical protein
MYPGYKRTHPHPTNTSALPAIVTLPPVPSPKRRTLENKPPAPYLPWLREHWEQGHRKLGEQEEQRQRKRVEREGERKSPEYRDS